jgi:DNA-binding XRE family transcriptional regulator
VATGDRVLREVQMDKSFKPAKQRATVSTGEAIRMLRELKGWTQEELARRCGVNAKNISMLEDDRADIASGGPRSWQRHSASIPPSSCSPSMRQT